MTRENEKKSREDTKTLMWLKRATFKKDGAGVQRDSERTREYGRGKYGER